MRWKTVSLIQIDRGACKISQSSMGAKNNDSAHSMYIMAATFPTPSIQFGNWNCKWVLRAIAVLTAGYGVYAFIRNTKKAH